MSNQSSRQDSIGRLKGRNSRNEDESAHQQGPTAHQPSSEDMRIVALAEEALAETIREGGAFASDNSN